MLVGTACTISHIKNYIYCPNCVFKYDIILKIVQITFLNRISHFATNYANCVTGYRAQFPNDVAGVGQIWPPLYRAVELHILSYKDTITVFTKTQSVFYCYGCFNSMCFVICVCVFVILTFTVFCLCTYLYCFVVILLFCVILMFCSYSCFVVIVVLCIFIFVCTSVGLLPPGESPIAVSNNIYYIYIYIYIYIYNYPHSYKRSSPAFTRPFWAKKRRGMKMYIRIDFRGPGQLSLY
jgi:hypothetical protein